MPPYLYERQTEYWTSRSIENYFLDAGFVIATFPISQLNERFLPADFVFDHPGVCKLFGFQYKALYRNGADHWHLDRRQHDQLQAYSDWIYYCFSGLREVSEQRVALHRVFIARVGFEYHTSIPHQGIRRVLGSYFRWAGFVAELERCRGGVKVTSADEIRAAVRRADRPLTTELDRDLVDVFVANLDGKRLLHFSPGAWERGQEVQ
jgi:hypothetical protein